MAFLRISRVMAGLVLALSATASLAHTGHGTTSFYEGLAHPFGVDHLLAMFAVGLWSISALPSQKAWWGPAAFMGVLVASAAVGASGVSVPFLEYMISFSVLLFGAMLLTVRARFPAVFGVGLIALAAAFHGLAHGAETPATGFAMYAVGFLLTTALLHFGGASLGLTIKRHLPRQAAAINASVGVLFGGTGLYLLSHL